MKGGTMRRLARILALVLLIAAVAGEAGAKPPSLREAVAAYRRGDFAAALEQLIPLANDDNAQAQFMLGMMYEGGQGVQRDLAAAARWYQAAARQGMPEAEAALRRIGQGAPSGGADDRSSIL